MNFTSMKKTLMKEDGFSLTEILVVIVIIGILVLLAMPKFTSVIGQAKKTEAKLMLKQLHTLQQTYYYANDRFADDLTAIGFDQERLVSDGGKARYRIEVVTADHQQYTGRATAVVDFDQDGNYNVWEVNQNGTIKQIRED